MSEEALRRACEALLSARPQCECSAGSGCEMAEARALIRAALSEGQAPEPVAQEPVAWSPKPIEWTKHQSEMVLKLTRRQQTEYGFCHPLYTHPAGMDAARAKAIEADAARLNSELREIRQAIGKLHDLAFPHMTLKGAGS